MDDLPSIPHADRDLPGHLELGAFSMSLNVADLTVSQAFYEKLGFVATGGDDGVYVIMKNGHSTLGLFQGVIETNVLTFNPGLTNRMELLEDYLDVREIQNRLTNQGVELTEPVAPDAGDSGPAHLALVDPDGNRILIDQFF